MLYVKRGFTIEEGAFGLIAWNYRPFGVTLEHTYQKENGKYKVKVAPGWYTCTRTRYNRGGYDTWLITGGDVTPDRRIMFHKGNHENDSDGCILVGEMIEPYKGGVGILQSGKAFDELMALTAGVDKFELFVGNDT
jgi:hypothetical protein